jgi:hypothetical protein
VVRGPYESIQVNVDYRGCNILGDAANEPSIAIDPTDPRKMVIGWRQFDTIESPFRQPGWAYSHSGGRTWTFAGVLSPCVFGGDPVLDTDADGNFYYLKFCCTSFGCGDLFKSDNGGISWDSVAGIGGGDKPWMVIDRTDGIGRNNIYIFWGFGNLFNRSTDEGATFEQYPSFLLSELYAGTMSVGLAGELYVAGQQGSFAKSLNAQDPQVSPTFDLEGVIDWCAGGSMRTAARADVSRLRDPDPNPRGLLGQPWIATDHSDGPNRGNVYLLEGVRWCQDPTADGVYFVRSTDGGVTWSDPVRVNDDPPTGNAWYWFAMMSVAPNGRIDAVWNDTRNYLDAPDANLCELYYAYSSDAGVTWSQNVPVSPVFDSHVGWPQQHKLGDYYHMISDNLGANVAYAATFNGEQDVYFLRIGPWDCNANEVPDEEDLAAGTSNDCNQNNIPDECERDCNSNAVPDDCDIASGTSPDTDGSGAPDECEGFMRLYVDAYATGNNDGSSWEDAFTDLRDAISSGVGSHGGAREIWVAAGTYRPDRSTGDRQAAFPLRSGMAVYGGFAGFETAIGQRDILANPTILSGDLNRDDGPDLENIDDNVLHVVVANGVDETAVLDGFVITGGYARESPALTQSCGGGILITQASPTVRNCTVYRNRSTYPGGGVSCSESSPVFDHCTFAYNYSNYEGGAISNSYGSAVFRECQFVENSTWYSGGAVSNWHSTMQAVGCLFSGNRTGVEGGAVCNARGEIDLTNSMLIGNYTAWGGGALDNSGKATVVNRHFSGSATTICPTGGGAIYNGIVGELTVVNSTIMHNSTAGGGGGIFNYSGSKLRVTGSIFWDNAESSGSELSSQIHTGDPLGSDNIDVSFSCIQGWWEYGGGLGNIAYDPLLRDPLGSDGIPGTPDDDLRLQSGSPCINRGDPAFEAQPGDTDLDGAPRVQGCRVDMGAYESTVVQDLGDFDGNGRFDLADLAGFQLCFAVGETTPGLHDACLCVFDFDAGEFIDLTDFAAFEPLLSGP